MARILVLTNLYPPNHFGGYELSCRDVVDRWRSWGHEVLVLTSSTVKPGVVSAPEPRDEVRRELRIAFDGRELERWPAARRLRYERANQTALQSALDDLRPDVVSVWHMAGMSLSLLHRLLTKHIRIVGVVCDEWPGYVEKTDQWMRLWRYLPPMWRAVSKLSGIPTGFPNVGYGASFCFVSHDLRDRCLKLSSWVFPQSTVTYSGINTLDFPIINRSANQNWTWNLTMAGRLDPRKGFSTAIEALTHLPVEARLEILSAADGPHRQELERKAGYLGVAERVHFDVGDRARVRSAFSRADAVLFPSTWEEPFGLVPVEAMACGTPVVASGTGGSVEFMASEYNCLLFSPGDPSSLADALHRLGASSQLRARLVANGRSTAVQLTIERVAADLEAWHLAAIDDFRTGVPGPPRDMRRYVRSGRVDKAQGNDSFAYRPGPQQSIPPHI